MICNSCGANSENNVTCNFCGSSVSSETTTKKISEKYTKRAQLLTLEPDLEYIYENPKNHNQVYERLIEKIEIYLEEKELKKAEFLANLAVDQFENNAYCYLKMARVNVYYALKTSGSVQTANIKQKYIGIARRLLGKYDYSEYALEKDKLVEILDSVDGQKADQWRNWSETEQFNKLDETPNVETPSVEAISDDGFLLFFYAIVGVVVLVAFLSLLAP
jgi:hypothetical protein